MAREGHRHRFATTQGIRQGCKLSPSLWNCVIIYVTHTLEQRLGPLWCTKHLVGFADDKLFKWSFANVSDVSAAIQEARCILQVLAELGLQVSQDKTVVLFKLAGSQATACRRKLVCKIDGKVHLRIQPDLTLPIKAQHTYLGAIIFVRPIRGPQCSASLSGRDCYLPASAQASSFPTHVAATQATASMAGLRDPIGILLSYRIRPYGQRGSTNSSRTT